MKKTILTVATLFVCFGLGAWSRRQHATVAYIAEQHLTPEAYATVKEILHGESMVIYASYMDMFKQVEKFEDGTTWPHLFASTNDCKPTMKDRHDALFLLDAAAKQMRDYKNLDDSTRLACMKQLIHLCGDVHCPGHVVFKDKRDHKHGKFEVVVPKNKKVRMHTYLDGDLLGAVFTGDYVGFANTCDPLLRRDPTDAEKAYMLEVQKGDIASWGHEIAECSTEVYKLVPEEGTVIDVVTEYKLALMCKEQVLRAGYRLAKILNDLFSE